MLIAHGIRLRAGENDRDTLLRRSIKLPFVCNLDPWLA